MWGAMMGKAPSALGGGVEAVAGAAEAAGKYKNEDSDSAFQAQLDSAAKQMASLQRIQDELKQDESKFQQEIAGYQGHLERASKNLATLQATKTRLEKELHQCVVAIEENERIKTKAAAAITRPPRARRRSAPSCARSRAHPHPPRPRRHRTARLSRGLARRRRRAIEHTRAGSRGRHGWRRLDGWRSDGPRCAGATAGGAVGRRAEL